MAFWNDEPTEADIATANSMREVAKHYSLELDSKFRRLDNLISHKFELGRAREFYVREFLKHFLPTTWAIGTGFVLMPNRDLVTQQDVVVYRTTRRPILMTVGDLVVIENEIALGTFEVKTRLSSVGEARESIEKLKPLRDAAPFVVGLFAWDAIAVDGLLDSIWAVVREQMRGGLSAERATLRLPDVIYIRGKYLVYARRDQNGLEREPMGVLELDGERLSDADALLGLVAILWLGSIPAFRHHSEKEDQEDRPGWLTHVKRSIDMAARRVSWPIDISLLRARRALEGTYIKANEQKLRNGDLGPVEQVENVLRAQAPGVTWSADRYGATGFPAETTVGWWTVRTTAGPHFRTTTHLGSQAEALEGVPPQGANSVPEALAHHLLACLDCLRRQPLAS